MIARHEPVMVAEMLAAIAPGDGRAYLDGTFGGGGWSAAILEAADCLVWAIDRDPGAIRIADAMAARYAGRLRPVEGRFGDMAALLADNGVERVDGVALDLGVSSMQLDDSARGFGFRSSGPLDMRMERRGESARDFVNGADEAELAEVIYRYGEERQARRIARAIVTARGKESISTTAQLADIVRGACRGGTRIDPATRTFQAIRIRINRELEELERGLKAAETVLAPGGRIAVVSFHSLEDRIVKTFLGERSARGAPASRHAPPAPSRQPAFRQRRRTAIRPAEEEVRRNPRARSARLRVAERIAKA